MKQKLIGILLVSAVLLSGCSSKSLFDNKASANGSTVSTSTNVSSGSNQETNSASTEQRVQVQTDLKPLKPGTAPQLSGVQKAQVNVKLGSTISNLDQSLKSIQDAQDVDLSSVN